MANGKCVEQEQWERAYHGDHHIGFSHSGGPPMSGRMDSFGLILPRHAISPLGFARAGCLWRLCQDAAVMSSEERGWSPQRYDEESVAFIASQMTVQHDGMLLWGESVEARTWVRDFRRGILSKRQVELWKGQTRVLSATQQWVHVSRVMDNGVATVRPARASDALLAAFEPLEGVGEEVRLLDCESEQGQWHRVGLEVWHTWMDPLGHANHPAYLDWCDEALARLVSQLGHDPHRLIPVAEQVRWRREVVAPTSLVVQTQRVGHTTQGAIRFAHRICSPDGEILYAEAITDRRMLEETGDWSVGLA